MRFKPILERILVPIDGTSGSLAAMQLATLIAKVFKSKVTVIHAISNELTSLEYQYASLITEGSGAPFGSPSPIPAELIKVYNEIENSFYRKGEEILRQAVAFFKEQGIAADEKLVEHVEPATAIMKQALEGIYDLIVIGRRGDEEKGPHLGSTTVKVAHHAEIPVLIVRQSGKISNVLIAFDGSQNAERALQYGAYLAKNIRAKMTVLYVCHSELSRLRPEQVREAGNHILSRASEILEETNLDQRVELGNPAETIIRVAQQGEYDLIVLGSKGHGAVERFLLGSVSEHVIHYADSSVLLVR